MHIDWSISIDGIVAAVMSVITIIAAVVLMRRDVADLKRNLKVVSAQVGNVADLVSEIHITLGRHDERIKSLEARQGERLHRERRSAQP